MGTTIQISLPGIVVCCVGAIMAFSANMISFVMIEKINERVPENERISYFSWGTNVRKIFKQLYPGNRLAILLHCCVVLMIVCFALGIWFWAFK